MATSSSSSRFVYPTTAIVCLIFFALGEAQKSDVQLVTSSNSCRVDRLSVYKVIFETYWSREKFPKQYPDWRPKAQWSKVVGRSHNSSYALWRLGSLATRGVKTFVETGNADVLNAESQGNGGIYDQFMAPPILVGAGKTKAEFFVDGNHSRVSLMARLHPSPDWFVGIDSFDLCEQGKLVDIVTIEVDPTDAGTQEGYTFTAPKWASEPQEKIYRISSLFPNNRYNGFYYPNLKKLPTIATFTFIKLKEFELSEVFKYDESKQYEYVEEETNVVYPGSIDPVPRIPSNTKVIDLEEAKPIVQPQNSTKKTEIDWIDDAPLPKTTTKKTPPRRRRLGPRNCRVSDWSAWGPCSRTCGIGQKYRTRSVIKHARRGGYPCPRLQEQTWCGSYVCPNVTRKHFEW